MSGMQFTGYLHIDGQKVLVLVRSAKYGKRLKLRKSGADGKHMTDEEVALSMPDFAEQKRNLLNGEVIGL